MIIKFSSAVLAILLLLISGLTHAQEPQMYGKVSIEKAIAALPKSSDNGFEEIRLVDNGDTGIRVFRVYNPVARHNHSYSSTYLKIESGRGLFRLEGKETFEAKEGDLMFWQRGVDHEVVDIIKGPLVFLAIDTPTRRSDDVQK